MAPQTAQPALEVADILRAHGSEYAAHHPVSAEQAAVIRHLTSCRTAALGGHLDACPDCGFQRVSYNSCRDRHCPKCQSAKQAQWVETRIERILPCPHFHVVFTIPEQLNPIALRNKRLIYGLLFKAAGETLLQLGSDSKRLGAQVGFTAVLHTWGQNLLFHPHLHCVVTGGGLSPDGERWIPTRGDYLFPVRVLSRLFRGKFLAALQGAYSDGLVECKGSTTSLARPEDFAALKRDLYRKEWVVYSKPPFAGAEHVYRYLARYTHRVAISNSRLLGMRDGKVRFRYKDYSDDCRQKVMDLDTEEFIRRFLLHVLPKGFVRVRHFGLLASINVSTRLESARRLLSSETLKTAVEAKETSIQSDTLAHWLEDNFLVCPQCGGKMKRVPLSDRRLAPVAVPVTAPPAAILDSS
ncbi:MAG: IS91 family transposase [Planctomycetota bacterium]